MGKLWLCYVYLVSSFLCYFCFVNTLLYHIRFGSCLYQYFNKKDNVELNYDVITQSNKIKGSSTSDKIVEGQIWVILNKYIKSKLNDNKTI